MRAYKTRTRPTNAKRYACTYCEHAQDQGYTVTDYHGGQEVAHFATMREFEKFMLRPDVILARLVIVYDQEAGRP